MQSFPPCTRCGYFNVPRWGRCWCCGHALATRQRRRRLRRGAGPERVHRARRPSVPHVPRGRALTDAEVLAAVSW